MQVPDAGTRISYRDNGHAGQGEVIGYRMLIKNGGHMDLLSADAEITELGAEPPAPPLPPEPGIRAFVQIGSLIFQRLPADGSLIFQRLPADGSLIFQRLPADGGECWRNVSVGGPFRSWRYLHDLAARDGLEIFELVAAPLRQV